MTEDDLPIRMITTDVSVLGASPARADTPGTGERISVMSLGRRDGTVEALSISLADSALLIKELLGAFSHFGIERAQDLICQVETLQELVAHLSDSQSERADECDPPAVNAFVSNLRPTGLEIRRWENGRELRYWLLGGYELLETSEYLLLCREVETTRDVHVFVRRREGELRSGLADRHSAALDLTLERWDWFGKLRPGARFRLGDPPVLCRKLGLKGLRGLIGKKSA